MAELLPYATGVLVVWLIAKVMRTGKREPYLPDGPPTVPLLGNLGIFPKVEAHFKLTEWARTYGGLYSLKMGPGTAIVITDATIVKDLMDKRSQVTIDRPANHKVEHVTGGMHIAFARYTEDWRTLRRVAQEMLTQPACAQHIPIQQAESAQLLYDCLVDPKGFYTHLRRNSSSVIFSVLFGKRAPRFETQEVHDFFESQHMWQRVLAPGTFPLVDFLPFLRHLPTPLAPWKVLCENTRQLQRKLFFGLLTEVEERVAQGYENGCFMEQVLARQAEFGMTRELVGYLGGTMIEAGSDTTSSWLQSLVLAMAAFPEAQRKAQAELDAVVGNDRAPTLEDFPRLPYIQAILNECHRWRPVAPLAVPHSNIEDITYRGFRIPAGTTIFVNSWGMLHDPDVYERPEDFWPDRWISNEFGTKHGVDDSDRRNNIWFGSGRRLCPGMHLATNSLIINTMNLIWAFNFGPEIDSTTGKPIPVDLYNYVTGIATCPEPFMCTITPRSKQHADIIRHEFAASEAAFAPYEHGLRAEDRSFVERQRREL
ncbi:cytochrome P450 [Ceratobasidium sp. AG-I]|nr:cytochrome P450 [Ceratobasidium sp. AG-I]